MGIVLNFLVILLKNQCIFVMENKNSHKSTIWEIYY